MFNGKMKAVTFSYDDGSLQDIRLTELFNKYGLKATFNLNSELLGTPNTLLRNGVTVDHTKVNPQDVKHIYDGHEVAVHTLTHPILTKIADDNEVIREIEEDRLKLSELAGYEVEGMAYPFGILNERIAELTRKHTGVKYARTITSTYAYDPQVNLYRFNPTVYHIMEPRRDRLMELGHEFVNLNPETPKIFYIWGHAFEFDIFPDGWEYFEEFCKLISGHDDIFYGTNKEVLL
ncbi:MAG: polysaccharide deacetylase family protein [Clostridia bacterium]|nr:polysaccharide deacetylase family protein [Clostridia bacterium]